MRKQAPRRNSSTGGGRNRASGPGGARRGRPAGNGEERFSGKRGTKRPYASARNKEDGFATDKPWRKKTSEERSADGAEKGAARRRSAAPKEAGSGRYERRGNNRYGSEQPWKKRETEEGAGDGGRRFSGNKGRFSSRGEESGRGRKPYGGGRRGAGAFDSDKPWKKRPGDDVRAEKDEKRSAYERRVGRKTRESGEYSEEKRPYKRRLSGSEEGAQPWKKRGTDERSERPASRGTYERKAAPEFEEGRKPRSPRTEKPGRERREKPESSRRDEGKAYVKKKAPYSERSPRSTGKTYREKGRKEESMPDISGEIRLNKFLANAGLCSRREADTFIESGVVTVNGVAVTEMGYKVKPGDEIKFGGRAVRREKPVYILMNKAKDHITTTDDPEGRKTVMELLKNGPKERVFPVGRLDRNTTGVLLFTNDGDLAERLMHPRYNIKKVYLAVLDKRLARGHMEELIQGIELEDGPIKADDVAYIADDKKNIGIEIHSGRNRIIHRMFEHLGYTVEKLDRTSYAGLGKKELKRGEWRYLHADELWALKKLVKLI